MIKRIVRYSQLLMCLLVCVGWWSSWVHPSAMGYSDGKKSWGLRLSAGSISLVRAEQYWILKSRWYFFTFDLKESDLLDMKPDKEIQFSGIEFIQDEMHVSFSSFKQAMIRIPFWMAFILSIVSFAAFRCTSGFVRWRRPASPGFVVDFHNAKLTKE